MGVIQAALSLYEREVGPMPDKVSYVEKVLQDGGSKPYSLCQWVQFSLLQ